MTPEISDLLKRALALSVDERAALANTLLESLETTDASVQEEIHNGDGLFRSDPSDGRHRSRGGHRSRRANRPIRGHRRKVKAAIEAFARCYGIAVIARQEAEFDGMGALRHRGDVLQFEVSRVVIRELRCCATSGKVARHTDCRR